MRLARLAAVLLLALETPAGADAAAPLTLVQTIPLPKVKGRIDHMALDADGKRLFVACLGNDSVEALDLEAGRVAATLPGQSEPQGVGVAAGRLVVANGGDGTVRFHDAKTLEIARTQELEGDADNVRVDAATDTVYVGFGTGAIAVLRKDGRGDDLRVGGHPEAFQLEAKGTRIFVNVPTTGRVAVVDRAVGKVVAHWPLGKAAANFPMALDETAGRLFVGCRSPSRLVVLDTTTGAVVSATEISGDVDDVFVDVSGKRLYAVCGEGFVDVLDRGEGDTWTRTARVETGAGARTGMLVPGSGRLYVAVPARGASKAEVRAYRVGG